MRVTFEHITEDWAREADLPAIPRNSDDVEIDGEEYQVQAVIWQPVSEPEPHVVVRLR